MAPYLAALVVLDPENPLHQAGVEFVLLAAQDLVAVAVVLARGGDRAGEVPPAGAERGGVGGGAGASGGRCGVQSEAVGHGDCIHVGRAQIGTVTSSVRSPALKKNIALGVDSTIIYASKLAGKWRNDGKVYLSDVNRRSPYNTRIYVGLPPGPVANSGDSSIDAALNPADTDYLYYVRDPNRNDGAHHFYNNDADFQRGVRALREWERNRDAQK